MKPLLAKDIAAFVERFENFQDAEFRSLELLSAQSTLVTFAVQDAARAFDWITISLEFQDIVDAALVADDKLHLIDMSEGVELTFENSFKFQIKNATFFIQAKSLKYQEGTF